MTKTQTNIIIVDTKIQAALFNDILRDQITVEGGRWFGVRTKGHADPFLTAKAVVAKEGQTERGLQFHAPKKNYNFNDSTWVNPAETLEKLMAVAVKANGGKEVAKKALVSELEALKNIFKNSTFKAPEAVVEATKADEKIVEEQPAA